jgi:hypothetical protein
VSMAESRDGRIELIEHELKTMEIVLSGLHDGMRLLLHTANDDYATYEFNQNNIRAVVQLVHQLDMRGVLFACDRWIEQNILKPTDEDILLFQRFVLQKSFDRSIDYLLKSSDLQLFGTFFAKHKSFLDANSLVTIIEKQNKHTVSLAKEKIQIASQWSGLRSNRTMDNTPRPSLFSVPTTVSTGPVAYATMHDMHAAVASASSLYVTDSP